MALPDAAGGVGGGDGATLEETSGSDAAVGQDVVSSEDSAPPDAAPDAAPDGGGGDATEIPCTKDADCVHLSGPCTTGTCDAAVGVCVTTAAPDDTPCTTGDLCSLGRRCAGGLCDAGVAVDCDDDDACTADTCEPTSGCVHSPIPGCCTPSCAGQDCGEDGCGGSCGDCGAGQACELGQCVSAGCDANPGDVLCPCETNFECDSGWCVDLGGPQRQCTQLCVDACPAGLVCTSSGASGSDLVFLCLPPCQASCTDKQCGADGCGGSCGTCAPGSTCDEAGQCVGGCVPQCADAQCGDDGCGGSCGVCQGAGWCDWYGMCQTGPKTSCVGRCGTAGGEGACDCDAFCFFLGTCCVDVCSACAAELPESCQCVPQCSGKVCGTDGCGGTCGVCPAGQGCASGACVPTAPTSCVGRCGEVTDGAPCQCDVDCGAFGECCADACAACAAELPEMCGACVPDCAGAVCGGDGCGGSCGTCADGATCEAGQCLPPSGSCAGRCGTFDLLEPCQCDGQCFALGDCCQDVCAECEATLPEHCGSCVPDCADSACGDDGCGGVCGKCAPGAVCQAGQCVITSGSCEARCGTFDLAEPCQCDAFCFGVGDCCSDLCAQCQATFPEECPACVPSCGGASCGPDGCGGSCGTCPAGSSCVAGVCTIPVASCAGRCGTFDLEQPCNCDAFCFDVGDCCEDLCAECAATFPDQCTACVPACDGKTCGPDGCGGSCGACPAGSSCVGGECAAGCTPQCADAVCGPDGCGGSCGDCAAGAWCDWFGKCQSGAATSCEGRCGVAGGEAACDCDGFCFFLGTCCGDVCTFCAEGFPQCPSGCEPDCTGKTCGSDGCGGTCGACSASQGCLEGTCVAVPEDSCQGRCGEYRPDAPCQCDDACTAFGECCADACTYCAPDIPGCN